MTVSRLAIPRALISAFALSVPPLGALAVGQTQIAALGTTLLDGSYQRVYEDRFKAELAGQQPLVDAWSAWRLGLLGELAEGAVLGRDGWLFTAEEFRDPARAVDLSDALVRTRAALEAHAITLVPVLVPDKARMAADRLPRARSDRFRARYDARLDDVAAANLPVLDLRPALAPTDSFLRTDTHWAPAGAARVARLVADHLAAIDLVRPGFTTAAQGSVALDGDLMGFARTGPWHVPGAPAPETITPHVTTGGAFGLLDAAPAIQIALVGTSFSARSDIHFDGFLKSAIGADLVNFAQEGQGPFAPMARFLAALDEGQAPDLRVVIWEIPERYLLTP